MDDWEQRSYKWYRNKEYLVNGKLKRGSILSFNFYVWQRPSEFHTTKGTELVEAIDIYRNTKLNNETLIAVFSYVN